MRWRQPMLALAFAPIATVFGQIKPGSGTLSGTWTGYIGESEAKPAAAKFELKAGSDGRVSGVVSGPNLTPGDIKTGTFDATTGALKLTVALRSENGDGGEVTLEGRVANDTASGTVLLGGRRGVFKLTKEHTGTGSTPKTTAKPGVASPDEFALAVKRGFTQVSDWITRGAEMVPADKYSYRPVGTVRTFGQLVAHVVDGSRFYCGRGAGRNVQWTDATEKGTTTKAALTQALKQAFAECNTAYDGANQFPPLMENVAHSSLHYGNMITYLRMMGMVPPSS